MIWGAATKVASKLMEGKDGESTPEVDNVIKRTLGLADTGIPIGREVEPAGYLRWTAAQNNGFETGVTKGAEGEVKWCEFLWTEPTSIDECEWDHVRWRFYENGLVCFDARMANASSQLDNGDVQGHRIELREENGMLLGVWIAGFFVRKSLPLRGFASSFTDTHMPLKLHFDEISKQQGGAWICI